MATEKATLSNYSMNECMTFPPNVHSAGVLNYVTKEGRIPFTLPNLEMQMVFIFVITQAFHFVLSNFGLPKFTSQMIAGLMLSPTLLGRFNAFSKFMFNIKSQEILGLLAEFGFALFMFLIGVKMDLGMINKTGQKALWTGVLCVLVPLLVGMFAQNQLTTYFFNHLTEEQLFSLPYVTATHCMTPFAVVAGLLEELKILNSEIGRLGISAALVSDIFTVFLQFLSTLTTGKRLTDKTQILRGLGSSIGYIIVAVAILRPAMLWVIRQTPENRPVMKAYVDIIITLMLGSGLFLHYYGQPFHLGPFIFGLVVPAGAPLGSAIEGRLDMFVSDVILPLFVTTCSMRTDFWSLASLRTDSCTQINGILLLVAFVFKFLSSMLVPLYCNMPFYDALALALILSCKGIVQLTVYTGFRDDQTLSEPTFALAVASVLVTATLIPIMMKFLYDPSRKYAGYQRRNIMHLKPNAELKVLACIHGSTNMPAVINLLDAACPSKENPISVYVLHLIELVGRASPIFISHQLQKKSASSTSYSDNVILYFSHFVRENVGAVSLSIFTAISQPKYMGEDVCTLALDKLVSLILLPFHRKWSIDGSVESEDNIIRNLNCSVIERAPCSVGILVDRGYLGRSTSVVSPHTSFSVAIIFLGGKDDREALAFAKRMANDSTISLTLIRFVAMNHEAGEDRESELDTEELKDFRYNRVGEEQFIYLEEVVKDGPQTALILRTMVDRYDLIIVGRRHMIQSPQTTGLSEWNEFPELGTIGDLLASLDFNCRASILVIQQQRMVTEKSNPRLAGQVQKF